MMCFDLKNHRRVFMKLKYSTLLIITNSITLIKLISLHKN